eukprot:scaffold49882_cov69-Phaeocystis_antarctica.AAC.3
MQFYRFNRVHALAGGWLPGRVVVRYSPCNTATSKLLQVYSSHRRKAAKVSADRVASGRLQPTVRLRRSRPRPAALV